MKKLKINSDESIPTREKGIGNLIPPARAYDPGAVQIAFAPGRLSSDLACHRLSAGRLGVRAIGAMTNVALVEHDEASAGALGGMGGDALLPGPGGMLGPVFGIFWIPLEKTDGRRCCG